MLGGNLGPLLYGDISVMYSILHLFYCGRIDQSVKGWERDSKEIGIYGLSLQTNPSANLWHINMAFKKNMLWD